MAEAPRQLFIGGVWRESSDGATFVVEDPSTGASLGEIADATPEDARAAIDAAASTQASWASVSPDARAEILYRTYDVLTQRADELALLLTLEMGKSLSESRAEIRYSAEYFRWFSGAAQRIDGSYKLAGNGESRILVMRQPVGPSFFITPWNFPSAMGARKIAPAIAAGCTMVVKPAAQTPLSMLALAEVLTDSGLPPGVLNVIPTTSPEAVSSPILNDLRLRKLSFTGSTAVGQKLLSRVADGVLRVSMELGGNAPFVVFDDADLDAAVEGAMIAKMRNVGEACTAANRLFVAAPIAEEFAARFAAKMGRLRLGRGSDEQTDVGPLIDNAQRERVSALVQDAVDRGARALVGGRRCDGPGYFYEPTVLVNVHPDSRVLSEEVFGPVAPVVRFSSEEEVISAANSTSYGLAAYLYTRDVKRALRVCDALEVGMVGLNQGIVSNPGAPFGGVKHSGLGREGGEEGILEFLETKYVAASL
jgi:succinate-semialdehyde dehydrogenase / glutarate-semialdehyde dehydrogenase